MAADQSARPRTGPGEDGLALRRVMRQWATGVAILTVRDGDEVRGMTCNSFVSVSDNPPLVLVCIHKTTRTHKLVTSARHFAISVLPADLQAWADRFAGVHGELHEQFGDVPHRVGSNGAPWLDGALGYIDCHVVAEHDGSTHTIFVAAVEQAEAGAESAPPLLRFRSAYVTLPR